MLNEKGENMTKSNRRAVLVGGAALGGVAAGVSLSGLGSLAFAESAGEGCPPALGPVKVGPDDPRYRYLVSRGINLRFDKQPEYIHVVGSTEQVVNAVQAAVDAGKRVTVRSGGHCFDNLVDNDEIIIDMSAMRGVYFDPEYNAFALEPGPQLTEVYRQLYLGWGVTIPSGSCPGVGVGGHILGGGYGPMSRLHGLSVDHLYGVEVVTVDADGKAKATVATREEDDPNRDLWWAHTGGGGGNFGIVTRYLMRSPVDSTDPTELLPRPPSELLAFACIWNWSDLDEESFSRIVAQHGRWHEDNSDPGSPNAGLHTVLMLNNRLSEVVMLVGEAKGDDPEAMVDEYLAAVGEGVTAEPFVSREPRPWLNSMLAADTEEISGPSRTKIKNGYLRQRFSDDQIAVLWEYLSEEDAQAFRSSWLVAYGGQVNAIDPEATAVAQRGSILKAIYITGWGDPAQDETELAWVRDLYRDIYAATDGVPALDERNEGCFVNYADVDLADPELNTSGTPWHELYYGGNYPRLQRIKAEWDPLNVFHHDLSIRPDASLEAVFEPAVLLRDVQAGASRRRCEALCTLRFLQKRRCAGPSPPLRLHSSGPPLTTNEVLRQPLIRLKCAGRSARDLST